MPLSSMLFSVATRAFWLPNVATSMSTKVVPSSIAATRSSPYLILMANFLQIKLTTISPISIATKPTSTWWLLACSISLCLPSMARSIRSTNLNNSLPFATNTIFLYIWMVHALAMPLHLRIAMSLCPTLPVYAMSSISVAPNVAYSLARLSLLPILPHYPTSSLW